MTRYTTKLNYKEKMVLCYVFADFEAAVVSINNSKVVVKVLQPKTFTNVPNYVYDRRIQNSNPTPQKHV